MRLELKKISWHFVWIIACFEGLAVSFLPYFSQVGTGGQIDKSQESGLLIGYIGMLAVLLIINIFGKYIFDEPISIRKPFVVSFWGSIYLFSIFVCQQVFTEIPYGIVTVVLKAVFSLSISTFLILIIYEKLTKVFPILSTRMVYMGSEYRLIGIPILPTILFVCMYEAIAMPIIELYKYIETYPWLAGLSCGFVGGALGMICVILSYNYLSKINPLLAESILLSTLHDEK